MYFKEKSAFFLKRSSVMILSLILDIGNSAAYMRNTYTESAVTNLPSEIGILYKIIMYPFGRTALQQSDRIGCCQRRWKREKQVNMVFNSTQGENLEFVLLSNIVEYFTETLMQIRCNSPFTVFCAENTMD